MNQDKCDPKIKTVLTEPQVQKSGDGAPISFDERSSCHNTSQHRRQVHDVGAKDGMSEPGEQTVEKRELHGCD